MTRTLFIALVAALALGSPAHAADGKSLYAANCSRCHGATGQGLQKLGPSIRDSGRLGVDFYLRTGYMPLQNSHSQPWRTRVLFSEQELDALVRYAGSLGDGPAVPHPRWRAASVSSGLKLFTDHCAGCHQIIARGGYVTGARVPALSRATPTQIAQAVRVGPYLMPNFSTKAITDTQLNDLVAYVQYTKHPADPGGWSIGHIGPWPEGMVSWLLATSVLVAVCTLFGRRLRS